MANMQTGLEPVATNISNSVEFTLSAANGNKLIKMLSSFLYTDKEYAVVSELAANGVDAHRMVGKETVPIQFNLPTLVESDVVVRDFGPGMSEENLFKYLTQFGESSKQGDENAIGFYGIGSKSVASVSDTWSITSYYEGKMIKLEVFVNEEGSLALSKVFEGKTEETGLEVRIPVETDKHRVWEAAAKKAFKHYKILPKFNRDINVPVTSYSAQTAKYGIRENNSMLIGINIITTMREYVLDRTKLNDSINDPLVRSMFNYRFDLFFETSTIDLSISREQIQYNTKTINAIVQRLTEIKEEILDEITSLLATAKNGVEYRAHGLKMWNKYPGIFLESVVKGNPLYGLKDLPNDFMKYSAILPKDMKVTIVHSNEAKSMKSRKFNCWNTYFVAIREVWDNTTSLYNKVLSLDINNINDIQIVTRDNVRDAATRIAYNGDPLKFYVIMDKNIFGSDVSAISATTFNKVSRVAKKQAPPANDDYWVLDGRRFVRCTKAQADLYQNKVSVNIINASSRDFNPEAISPEINFLSNWKVGYKIIGHKSGVLAYDTAKVALAKYIEELKARPEIKTEIETIRIQQLKAAIINSRTVANIIAHKIESNRIKEVFKPMQNMLDLMQINSLSQGKTVSEFINKYRIFKDTPFIKLLKVALKLINETLPEIDEFDYASIENACQEMYPLLKYVEFDMSFSFNQQKAIYMQQYVNFMDSSLLKNN